MQLWVAEIDAPPIYGSVSHICNEIISDTVEKKRRLPYRKRLSTSIVNTYALITILFGLAFAPVFFAVIFASAAAFFAGFSGFFGPAARPSGFFMIARVISSTAFLWFALTVSSSSGLLVCAFLIKS